MNRCYGYQCSRKGIFELEPVEGYHVWMCRKCFEDKYGEGAAARYLMGTLPMPKPAQEVAVEYRGESVRTIRSSGFGPAIPFDYRRDVNDRMFL